MKAHARMAARFAAATSALIEDVTQAAPRRQLPDDSALSEAEWKRRVQCSFGEAAETYDAQAGLQRTIAVELARRVSDLPLPRNARVLEIGCGTGLLTSALRDRFADGRWVATDISPAMVSRCRDRFETGKTTFVCMDGEWPAVEGGYDLICSSMAMQWFARPRASIPNLAKLLRPGGRLCFSTLVEGTFREWREAHQRLGIPSSTLDYLSAHALRALWPGPGQLDVVSYERAHASARAFVAGLKQLGAHTPARRAQRSHLSALRDLLRYFDRPEGIRVTYEVAYAVLQRG